MGDLTTLANVKSYLRREFSDPSYGSQDVELARLITAVSSEVRAACNQSLSVPAATVTERRHGDGSRRMLLNEGPIYSVTSVTVDGDTIPAQPSATEDGWFLDGDVLELAGYYFTEGRGNVTIVYTAGFTVSDPHTIPAAPYQVEAEYPFAENVSVTIAGAAATKVTGTPTAGQYAVTDAGLYTFAAADTGKAAVLVYGYRPQDLEDAVVQLVALKWYRAKAPAQSSLSVNGDTLQFDGGAHYANAMGIVEKYRRFAVG